MVRSLLVSSSPRDLTVEVRRLQVLGFLLTVGFALYRLLIVRRRRDPIDFVDVAMDRRFGY